MNGCPASGVSLGRWEPEGLGYLMRLGEEVVQLVLQDTAVGLHCCGGLLEQVPGRKSRQLGVSVLNIRVMKE